jgi:hypothetical protein
LGDRIRVEGNLCVTRCDQLRQLPSDLFVGGKFLIRPNRFNGNLIVQVPPDKIWDRVIPPPISIRNFPPALDDLNAPCR